MTCINRFLAVFGLLCAFLLVGSPIRVAAQGDGGRSAINDLKTAISRIAWDSGAQGPLLSVASETVTWPETDDRERGVEFLTNVAVRKPLLAPRVGRGLDATVVARHFRRKLIRVGGLTVFAPPTMVVLNPDLPPADPLLGAPTAGRTRRLEATLTPAQWKLLGSAGGLGVGDMTPEQVPIFEDVLPATMQIGAESTQKSDQGREEVQEGTVQTLTPAQRKEVRLHVTRKATFHLIDANNGYVGFDNPFHSDAPNVRRMIAVDSETSAAARSTLFGQAVRRELPNALKPSDLDLKQSPFVATTLTLTGVKTVGDLLRAVAAKTGVELYADGRFSRLSVAVIGPRQAVRAADVLEALCWSLTATFRKVGGDGKDSAYVLTHDRAGLGALRGTIEEWEARGSAQRQTAEKSYYTAIKKLQPGKYIGYAVGDLLTPTPDALEALHEAQNHKRSIGSVPVTVLTGEQRRQMTEAIRQSNARRSTDSIFPPARTDRVGLSIDFTLSYLVPDGGEVRSTATWSYFDEMDGGGSGPDGLADAFLSSGFSTGLMKMVAAMMKSEDAFAVSRAILSIAPKSIEDASPVVAAATAAGIDEVWISTPDTDAGRKLLADCVALGKTDGVKIGAQVNLLRVPTIDTQPEVRVEDRNIFGETGEEWAIHSRRQSAASETTALLPFFALPKTPVDDRDLLAPESPLTRQLVRRRLRDVLATPGLSSMALSEPAGPGHDWATTKAGESSLIGGTFGYTVANRLAFIRQRGYDPIDLNDPADRLAAVTLFDLGSLFGKPSDPKLGAALLLPFFGEGSADEFSFSTEPTEAKKMEAVADAWQRLRAQTERTFLNSLRIDLRAGAPTMPVLLGSYPAGPTQAFQRWDLTGRLPFGAPVPNTTNSSAETEIAADPTSGFLYHVVFDATAPAEIADMRKGMIASDSTLKDIPLGRFTDALISNRVQASSRARKAPESPGIVLDFTSVDPAKILPLLNGALHVDAKH